MCGGLVSAIFGGGNDTPAQTTVASDPTPTAVNDVSGDTKKAGAGETKKKKNRGFTSTSIATPLSASSNAFASATNGTGSSKNLGSNGV